MIVSANPSIDTPHPIHVMIESVFDCSLFWDTSNNKAKFVKWSHSQVTKPLYACVFDTLQPSFDHEPITPAVETVKYIFKTLLEKIKWLVRVKVLEYESFK